MVGLPLFGKGASGTPVFKILVRALSHVQTARESYDLNMAFAASNRFA